jgi:hypothetical protein
MGATARRGENQTPAKSVAIPGARANRVVRRALPSMGIDTCEDGEVVDSTGVSGTDSESARAARDALLIVRARAPMNAE